LNKFAEISELTTLVEMIFVNAAATDYSHQWSTPPHRYTGWWWNHLKGF